MPGLSSKTSNNVSHYTSGTLAQHFQILSLDGGGIKGLYSAAVLAALEDDLQVNVIDHFDLMVVDQLA